jgi:tetratricopeptide (TPR) repeat protein
MKNKSKKIERLINEENWDEARRQIEMELELTPDSHWLLDRLSVTYYEQLNYKTALKIIKKAYKLSPNCPLVLWDYAGTCDAVGDHAGAVRLYSHIIVNYPENAGDTCNEGDIWIQSLVLDCFYRLAISFEKMANPQQAKWFVEGYIRICKSHLELQSIYNVAIAKRYLDRLTKSNGTMKKFDDIAFETKQANGILAEYAAAIDCS